jgi:uncharacterized pyridoxal phosphate-containing UPF0001 family protein
MSVSNNLAEIQNRIRTAALRANRSPDEITLIAVTKYVELEPINEAIRCGITDIAENRVQEGVRKFPEVTGSPRKHLIGSLQTNKVKPALDCFDLIHSVDRPALIQELAKQAGRRERPAEFLIELNISGKSPNMDWLRTAWALC